MIIHREKGEGRAMHSQLVASGRATFLRSERCAASNSLLVRYSCASTFSLLPRHEITRWLSLFRGFPLDEPWSRITRHIGVDSTYHVTSHFCKFKWRSTSEAFLFFQIKCLCWSEIVKYDCYIFLYSVRRN